MIYTRDEAAKIMEVFEDALEKNGMVLPDEDREADGSDAPIYGMTYWNMLYQIEERLSELIDRADHEAVITQEFSGR